MSVWGCQKSIFPFNIIYAHVVNVLSDPHKTKFSFYT